MDLESGVICVPENFKYAEREFPEGIIRVTCLANYDLWKSYPELQYREEKEAWQPKIWESAKSFMPETSLDYSKEARIAFDMFTPTTVGRYTWRKRGPSMVQLKSTEPGLRPFRISFFVEPTKVS